MAMFEISAMYEYGATIEADSKEEAEQIFLDDLNAYYYGTYSYDCEEVEEEEDADE
jgi:hypothetical protein